MRPRVKTRGLELSADLVEKALQVVARRPFQQAIHRVHPKTDGLHVKRGDGPPQGLHLFAQLIAWSGMAGAAESGSERIDSGQGGSSPGHPTGNLHAYAIQTCRARAGQAHVCSGVPYT